MQYAVIKYYLYCTKNLQENVKKLNSNVIKFINYEAKYIRSRPNLKVS